MQTSARSRYRGFSLIELMVAVAIVGIIAAIAYPTYTKQMQRGRRADAIAAMTAVMQAQERYRSSYSSYAATMSTLGVDGDLPKIAPNYSFSDPTGVVIGTNAPDLQRGYVVTATPLSTGKQAGDKTCKSFTVELKGGTPTYSSKGDPDNTGSDVDTTASCWPR